MDILKPIYGEVWAASGEKLAPENTKIESGWILEMMPYQYENFLQNRQDVAITYLMQKGVSEWSGEQEYTANKSVVQYQGHLYIATATVTNVVPTVTTSWRKLTVVVGANGTIPIGSGGTGATTAAQARANLGIGSAGGLDLPVANGLLIKLANNTLAARSVIGTDGLIEVVNGDGVAGNPTITVGNSVVRTNADASWTTTGSIRLPTGTTAQRGVAAAGRIRFNLDTATFEGYDGTAWTAVGTTGVFDVQNFSGNGVITSFTLSTTPRSENNTQVYINGIYQQKNTYELTDSVITFSVAPMEGVDNIEVVTATSVAIGTTTAAQTSITDSGNYYSSGNVEGALQQVGSTLSKAILSFPDLASAEAAAMSLPDGQLVDVDSEQNHYQVNEGVLVLEGEFTSKLLAGENGDKHIGIRRPEAAAIIRSQYDKNNERYSSRDFGVNGSNSNNSPNMQLMIDAMVASNWGEVEIVRDGWLQCEEPVTIGGGISVRGQGRAATRLVRYESPDSNFFVIDDEAVTIQNLSLQGKGMGASTTDTFAITTTNKAHRFVARDVGISHVAAGIQLRSGIFLVDACEIRDYKPGTGKAISIDQSGLIDGVGTISNSIVGTAGGAASPYCGIEMLHATGILLASNQIMQSGIALVLAPKVGSIVTSVKAVNTYFDTSINGGVFIDPRNGAVQRVTFGDSWFASSTNGAGIRVQQDCWVDGLLVDACEFYANQNGILTEEGVKGSRIIVSNSVFSGNISADISIGSNNSGITLENNFCGAHGGFSESPTSLYVNGGGTNNMTIKNNDFRATAVVEQPSNPLMYISDNLGL